MDKGRAVFIDTNLDTHLALIVFDHDTVSDLKTKILSEHPACFPKIGHIQVNGIKVKRNGSFYHLSDSMSVRSAFSILKRTWFLSVDVSALGDCGQNEQLVSHASPDRVDSRAIANNAVVVHHDNAVGLPSNLQLLQLEKNRNENEEIPVVSPCVSERTAKEAVSNLEGGVKSSGDNDTGTPLPVSTPETEGRSNVNQEVPRLPIECVVGGSGKGNKDDCNVCDKEPSISVPSAKKKQKRKRNKEDTVGGDNLKDNIASVDNPFSCPSQRASSFNNFPVPQSENKRNESEEIPVLSPCVSAHTAKEAVTNLKGGVKSSGDIDTGTPLPVSTPATEDRSVVNQEVPRLPIECVVDGSGKGNKDDGNVCDKEPSISVPSAKKKQKRKRNKEDTVGGDNLKDNIASVDNPFSCPSQRASSFNNFPVPQSENKLNESEEIPFDGSCVLEHTENEAVKILEMGVKSSGNNDHGILFPSSIPETQDNFCVNHELPNSHIECEVDGSNKDTKDNCIVPEEGTSKPAPSAKKKHKNRKRKKEDIVRDDTSKENDASVVVPGDYTVPQDIVVLANPSENADKEVIKETEVLKEHQHPECNNNSTKNDVDAVPMNEASEPSPAENIKHKKRKTRDSKELLKLETASQKDSAQMSNDAHEERKESNDQCELNNDKSGGKAEYRQNKAEDISDTRPPAKKRKGKVKSTVKSLSKKELVNDINGDNSSHHLLEDQQNIRNSRADQSAEYFNDADQLRTSVLSLKKKGKISSSDLHETPLVTSSREDKEANHSSIHREDIIMSQMTPDKMEIGTDACKVQPSDDVNEPKDLTENSENVVLGHCHESEAGQNEGAKEGKQVSPQNDPKLMPLERRTPSKQGNTTSDIRELKTTSNVVDVNGMNEPVKSEKKKRGVKKARNSGGGPVLREDIGPVESFESDAKSLKATICDPISGNTETEENPLNQTEGKKIGQEEMQGTVLSVTDKKDDFNADNAGSLEQIKTKSNAENVDEHVDKRPIKKSNNKQASTSKSTSIMLTKDQDLDSKKEHDVHRICRDKKVPKAHKTAQDAKLSSRSDSAMSSIGEKRKPRNNASGKSMDLEKRREHIPISNSKLEGSNNLVQNKARKAPRNNVGGVVSNTQRKKSLLEGAIFNDDSSGTSEDGDQVDNSDASTRSPSANSLLSDFSDGENSAGLDSQQNGSDSGKRLENGERSSLKASLSGTKGMSIDRVLRSSTRYKKAKIMASQMDESESQPEFVPDSLPC